MENSILDSIKDASGASVDDSAFDQELILHINSAFMTLRQLGVGPEIPFSIESNSEVWSSFTTDEAILPMVKSYVTLKVRTLFDPPTSASLATALKDTLAEYEWRLNIEADDYDVEEGEEND